MEVLRAWPIMPATLDLVELAIEVWDEPAIEAVPARKRRGSCDATFGSRRSSIGTGDEMPVAITLVSCL